PPPSSPFPYTTLFRSWRVAALRSLLLPAQYTQLAVKPGDHTIKIGQDFTLEATLTGRPVADATLHYRAVGTDEDWTKLSLAPPRSEEHTSELQSRGHL